MVKSQVITLESAFLREILAGLVEPPPVEPPLIADGSAAASVTGTGSVAWSNPANALVAGDDAATCTVSSQFSNWLEIRGWQLAAMPDVIPVGIRISVDCMISEGASMSWNGFELLKAGEVAGFDLGSSVSTPTTTRTVRSAGGPTNLLFTEWTRAELLHPLTGVRFSVGTSGATTISIFRVFFTVWWEV
jgi:hypothetical protein